MAALALAACSASVESAPAGDEAVGASPALELTGRVVDAADILSPDYETALTDKLEELEERTLVQLVVATTPDLKGHEIEDYSFDLANAWGLGSAERKDGLLLLVAPNERKVRIEVGLGLEASVKDEEAAHIIRTAILPSFRDSDYEAGIDAGVDGLIAEVTPYELKEAA
ncbi:TPM domain-containing protein [Erythrobacter sp. SCSIO 43205]|nr:TPM domain-containing protein [Erythrobacter sp. SCSIO 43205]